MPTVIRKCSDRRLAAVKIHQNFYETVKELEYQMQRQKYSKWLRFWTLSILENTTFRKLNLFLSSGEKWEKPILFGREIEVSSF
jgi:hypothetical protein